MRAKITGWNASGSTSRDDTPDIPAAYESLELHAVLLDPPSYKGASYLTLDLSTFTEPGPGLIQKRRGLDPGHFNAWAWVPPGQLNLLATILVARRPLFLELHLKEPLRYGKAVLRHVRWTTDPAE